MEQTARTDSQHPPKKRMPDWTVLDMVRGFLLGSVDGVIAFAEGMHEAHGRGVLVGEVWDLLDASSFDKPLPLDYALPDSDGIPLEARQDPNYREYFRRWIRIHEPGSEAVGVVTDSGHPSRDPMFFYINRDPRHDGCSWRVVLMQGQ